jgi:hypothetical protein
VSVCVCVCVDYRVMTETIAAYTRNSGQCGWGEWVP